MRMKGFEVLLFILIVVLLFVMCLVQLRQETEVADQESEEAEEATEEEPEEVQLVIEEVPVKPLVEAEAIQEPEPEDVPVQEEETILEAMKTYDVPLEENLQLFIIQACEAYHIEPAVVMAVIEHESGFRADAMGDSGRSYGLMQIQKRWHEGRMDKLGVTDLLDPYQNVMVGIDYLAEMVDHYDGDVEMALVAYNAGMGGANEHWFSKGIYSSSYSRSILAQSEILKVGA